MGRDGLGVRAVLWLVAAGLGCAEELDATDPPDRDPPTERCPAVPPLTGEEEATLSLDLARDPLHARRDAGSDAADVADAPSTTRDASVDATPPRERCGDGLDDDGDGEVDEGCACVPGASQGCYGGDPTRAGRGECARGTQRCEGGGELGAWGRCVGWAAPAAERCDGLDDDCDDATDEDCGCALDAQRQCYDGPAGSLGVGLCREGTQRCEATAGGPTRWGACEGARRPETERCDGEDNDCDGATDEGCPCDPSVAMPCYDGPSGTLGAGRCQGGTRRCTGAGPAGITYGPCEGQVLPEAEVCGNALDDDCDGAFDCSDPACREAVGCADGALVVDNFDVPRYPVQALFVVDGSSSMARRDAHGVTRWEGALRVLRPLLPDLDDAVAVGLLLFPVPARCAVVEPSVAPFSGGAATVLEALSAASPSGGTPLDAVMAEIERFHAATPFEGERVVVLVTDGAQSCPGEGPPSVRLRRLATERRLSTYVLGVHGDVCENQAQLRALAIAGGRPRIFPPPYYEADSAASELGFNLRWLVTRLRDCAIELTETPSPRFDLTVSFDDRPLPRGSDGWSFADARRRILSINGSACEAMATARVRVITARYGAALAP